MLYRDEVLGQASLGKRLAARLALWLSRRRYQDLDVLSASPHLRRDIGLGEAEIGAPQALEVWRK